MPTTYTDQFYVMDPGNPPDRGTTLTVETYDFIDEDENAFISPSGNDSFDGSDITDVWVDDRILVVIDGSRVWITGVTFYTADGRAVFTPTDGTVLEDAVFRRSDFVEVSTQVPVGDFGPPCFAGGTLIRTEHGLRPVEDIAVGDRIPTRDHGLQEVRWVGHRRVRGDGDYAPIRFAPGSFGNDRALLVSPQHRMLVTGWRAELFFGEDEVLVAAKHLVNGDTIRQTPVDWIDYHHILFNDHEMIEGEGILSESFHPGTYIMMADAGIRAELLALFPDLNPEPGKGGRRTARFVLKGTEARILEQPVLCAA